MFEPSDTAEFRDKNTNGILHNLWSHVSGWIHSLESKYADLISEDLEWTSKMEGIVRAGSYLMTLGQSEFISELVYSISNAMVLFNDSIILSVLRRKSNQTFLKKILFKTLAILETFQVSIEMITKRYLGERWKWTVITLVSLLKSLSRALLVFYLRAGVSHCQVAQPIDRQLIVNKHQVEGEVGDGPAVTSAGKAWLGARTNKVIRSVQDDFNRPYEELKEVRAHFHDPVGPDEVPWSRLSRNQLIAEGISTVKPIAHLLSMAAFGETSIKSWLIPLAMDIISLYLMESGGTNFHKRELQELTKRKFNFIFYIMRSPVYDKYFKSKLMSILGFLANRIPLFGRLIGNELETQFGELTDYLKKNVLLGELEEIHNKSKRENEKHQLSISELEKALRSNRDIFQSSTLKEIQSGIIKLWKEIEPELNPIIFISILMIHLLVSNIINGLSRNVELSYELE